MIQRATDGTPCPQCGAAVRGDQAACWLCGAAIGSQGPAPPPAATAVAHHQTYSFSVSTMLLVTTLTAVSLGLIVMFPGVGIAIVILLAPVLLRTAIVVKRREQAGRPVSTVEQVGLFTSSLIVAHVMTAVVMMASVGTFCGTCLGLAAVTPRFNYNNQGQVTLFMVLSGIAALITTFFALRWAWRWMRRRYRRAVGAVDSGTPSRAEGLLLERTVGLVRRHRRAASWGVVAGLVTGGLAWIMMWDAVYFSGQVAPAHPPIVIASFCTAVVTCLIVGAVVEWHSRRGSS